MPRPLPVLPRGVPLRPRRPKPTRLLLACPTISPEYALKAFHALVRPKPFRRQAIEHRTGQQPWPAHADQLVRDTVAALLARFPTDARVHLATPGDYLAAIDLPAADLEIAKALAVVLSLNLPDTWWTLGPLTIHAGRFHRYMGKTIRRLTRAPSIHLPRDLRSAVREITQNSEP